MRGVSSARGVLECNAASVEQPERGLSFSRCNELQAAVSRWHFLYVRQHFGLVFFNVSILDLYFSMSAVWTCIFQCQHFGLVFLHVSSFLMSVSIFNFVATF
jgi:hypothetical protein